MTESNAPSVVVSRRAWLAVAGVSAMAGVGAAWWRWQPAPVADAAVAGLWDLTFPTPDGATLKLASWRGRKLVINFWATWCPPCVEELPMLNAFHLAQGSGKTPNGWQVLGLAVDQPGAVQQFMKRLPISFPVGMAGMAGVDLSRGLGNANGGLPFTVALLPDGTVFQRKIGKLAPSDVEAWSKA